jgi:hypothetical protein
MKKRNGMKSNRFLMVAIFSIAVHVYAQENPLKEIGINDFSGTKISDTTWSGYIGPLGFGALVIKNDSGKKYKFHITYVEDPGAKLKYVNDIPVSVTTEAYYPMPKGLFRAASGLILARQPGKSGEDERDFWNFRWDSEKKKWLEHNTDTDLQTIERFEHPSKKITDAFKSQANLQKPKATKVEVKKPAIFSSLSHKLNRLTKKLSELEKQLKVLS